MKTDINGCSTCANGTENYEVFRAHGKTYYQYDYRTENGNLFSTTAPTLEICRKRRDKWLMTH